MSKQIHNKMHIFKKALSILLVLDLAGLVLSIINVIPTFKMMGEYGQIMLVVLCVMTFVMTAFALFEIFAKLFLIRSTSPDFSWADRPKGYVTAAKLLLWFNLAAVVLNLLSTGGEGATLSNQLQLYLQILADGAEVIVVFLYLRAVKRMVASQQAEC